MSSENQGAERLSIWENRLSLAERRMEDIELRLAIIGQDLHEAAGLDQLGRGLGIRKALFQVSATGCSSLALTSEPCKARLMWGDVYNFGTSTDIGDQPMNPSQDVLCTSDPSTGLVSFLMPWPNGIDLLGQVFPLNQLQYVVWNAGLGAYVFDPTFTSGITAWANVQVYTIETGMYNGHGWHNASVSNTPAVITSCMQPVPTGNSWTYGGGTNNAYSCWNGSGSARTLSVHSLSFSTAGGGSGTFGSTYATLTIAYSGFASVWRWTGATWSSSIFGPYNFFFSFNTSTKALTCTLYHVNPGGGDKLVGAGFEFVGSPAPSAVAATVSPTINPVPSFSAVYDFSATAINTWTGLTTVTLLQP